MLQKGTVYKNKNYIYGKNEIKVTRKLPRLPVFHTFMLSDNKIVCSHNIHKGD